MIQNALFELLTRLATRHGPLTLLACFLFTLLCLPLVAARLNIQTNFSAVLGDDPMALVQREMETNFPGAYTVQIGVEGLSRDRLVEVAKEIETAARGVDGVSEVYLEQPVDFFFDHGLLYVPTDDLRLAEAAVSEWEGTMAAVYRDPSLRGLLRLMDEVAAKQSASGNGIVTVGAKSFGRLLLGQGPWEGAGVELGLEFDTRPMTEAAHEAVISTFTEVPLPPSKAGMQSFLPSTTGLLSALADTLDEGERVSDVLFAERVQKLRELDLARLGGQAERYTISPDGTMLLMDVGASVNLADIRVSEPFLRRLMSAVDAVQDRNPDVEVRMAGLPVMLVEESSVILDNFLVITLLGYIGILAVFVIGFERVAMPSLAAIPLVTGTIWTFAAICAFTDGTVTLLAMAFPVLLFGIGIDYAIHIMAAYAEHRSAGLREEEALRQTYAKLGAGLLTGAFTTAGAFLVLLTSDFYGLQNMGFTAGIGVLNALLAVLLILPPLLVWFDRRQKEGTELLPNVPFTFLAPVGVFLHRYRYWALAAFLGLTITFGYTSTSVSLDKNYMNALPQGLPSLQAQEAILKKFGGSNEMITFVAKDLEEAKRIGDLATKMGTVSNVLSPAQLIPDAQEEKREILDSLAKRLEAVISEPPGSPPEYSSDELVAMKRRLASIKASLLEVSLAAAVLYDRETQDQIGLVRDLVNRIDAHLAPASIPRLQHLDRLIRQEVTTSAEQFRTMVRAPNVTEDRLPASIVKRMRGNDGGWIVLVQASGDVWEEDFRKALLSELDTIPAPRVGMVPTWDRFQTLILGALPSATMAIFAVVALVVLIDLRSIRGTILAMVPLVSGLVWTVGLMGSLGIQFNIVSVISVPILVGVGIDYGVHLYHRVHQDGALGPALVNVGKPLLLCALTTAIGFGSLMLSVHPGLFSLGFVSTVGIFASLLVSLFLLPPLIAIFQEQILREPHR